MMLSDDQLRLWANGTSVHNAERDECCPDFSCCRPELLQPEKIRRAFVEAGEGERFKLLGLFLSTAIASYKPETRVYIAGESQDA